MFTGQSAIKKTFYNKARKKKKTRVSYNKGKFLFFRGKMLQRQNVPAIKSLCTKSSGRHNVDTKKFKIRVKKSSPSHKKENIGK